MSATPTAVSRNYNKQPQKTFVTTVVFNTKLFTYSTSLNSNFQTVGSLVANTAATATNCPQNRVLHANGKTLLPGVNPSITKPYFGVFDPVSGLNGFIDATDPAFAVYDTNFPFQYDSGLQPAFSTLGGQGANVRQGTDAETLTQTSGLVGSLSVNLGDSTSGEVKFAANSSTIQVNGSQITTSSRVFLQSVVGLGQVTTGAFSTLQTGLPILPSVSSIVNGSFNVSLPAPTYVGQNLNYSFFVLH
jgi:hypothetical protein